MTRTHQPGEDRFRAILPEDIAWVKVPSGVKLMPHKHPEDRVYTVMSGVFYIGLGDKFDADR